MVKFNSVLLTSDSNPKLKKAMKFGYFNVGLSLAPHKSSGKNVCPDSSATCRKHCLYEQGFGRIYPKVNMARIRKTNYLFNSRKDFLEVLTEDIRKANVFSVGKLGMKLAVRLNLFSDIAWEKYLDFEYFRNIQFYDYTKSKKRMINFLDNKMPKNYHLTFSRSESNEIECINVFNSGGNVSVVFEKIPKTWKTFDVINGEENDLRFLDNHVIVGLKPKGSMKYDTTGYVVRT